MYNTYEKKLNTITKKYESVLVEQTTPEQIINSATTKSKLGLAAKTSKDKKKYVFSIKELRSILDSLVKTGVNNVDQNKLATIRKWAALALDNNDDQGTLPTWTLVSQIRSGSLGNNRTQLYKDATQLTKLIIELQSKSKLSTIDSSIQAGGFTYEQLIKAYRDAKTKNTSLINALSAIKGAPVSRSTLKEIFEFVGQEFEKVATELQKYDSELVTQVDSIKQQYLNDPKSDAETRRVVKTLTYYDGLRQNLKNPAYKEVRDYTQNVYLPKVSSILPTVNALGNLVLELQRYEKEWQLNKEIQEFLDAMALWKGAEATRIRLEKLAKFKAADVQSMENFYKQIPELLWREVERVQNFEAGYRNDPTGIFPRWQGNIQVSQPGLNNLNDKVGNYLRKNIGDKLDFYNNFSEIFRDKETFTNYVLDPKNREQAIYKLQDLYVDILSLEELIQLQENNLPVKIKLPNVPEISLTTKDEDGQTVNWGDYNLRSVINTNNIKSAINWFAETLPKRISAYDQRAETSIGRAITNIDFDALNQKAKSQADQMFELIQMSSAAGEEEFANREEIRQRAEDTVMQDRLKAAQQAASALAVQAQFNLQDEEISRQVEQEKITTQTIETLDLIISAINVATNDIDNRSIKDIYEVVNYITVVFSSLSGEYYEDSRISKKFSQIEDSFQDLLRAKVASVDTDLDQALDLAQVELDKESSRDINKDIVEQLLNIAQDSNLKGIEDAYPRGFTDFTLNTESVDAKLLELANAIKELNRRLDRDNDPFFVLWYEITEDMDDLIARIKDLELDDIVPVVEKLDELESLIDDDNMQSNFDKMLDTIETIVDITLTHKLNEAGSIFNEIRNNLIDAEGNLKPTDEYEYEDFESYADLWELFKTIEEMYDALDLEPSQLYNEVAKKIAALAKVIPIEKMPFSGRSRDDFLDWVVKYGPKSSGRGDGELEVAGRKEFRRTAMDEIGLPLYNNEGDYLATEKQRKKFIRDTVIDSTPEEVRRMLFKRRKQHFETLTQFSGRGQARKDPYIKEVGKAVVRDNPGLKRIEVVTLRTGFMLDNYLDSYINLAGEYMPQLKDPPGYGNEFDIRSDLLNDEEN